MTPSTEHPDNYPLDQPRCVHCGRPELYHGKFMGTCFRGGKALRTTFTAPESPKPVKE